MVLDLVIGWGKGNERGELRGLEIRFTKDGQFLETAENADAEF